MFVHILGCVSRTGRTSASSDSNHERKIRFRCGSLFGLCDLIRLLVEKRKTIHFRTPRCFLVLSGELRKIRILFSQGHSKIPEYQFLRITFTSSYLNSRVSLSLSLSTSATRRNTQVDTCKHFGARVYSTEGTCIRISYRSLSALLSNSKYIPGTPPHHSAENVYVARDVDKETR